MGQRTLPERESSWRSAWMALERVSSWALAGGGDDRGGISRHRPPPDRRCLLRAVMILSRLSTTCRYISTMRAWPRAWAVEMIRRVCWCCWRCRGRNSAVVRNKGQVRHEYACGQDWPIGRPQYPFGSAWVARGEALLGRGGLGQWTVRVEGDNPEQAAHCSPRRPTATCDCCNEPMGAAGLPA